MGFWNRLFGHKKKDLSEIVEEFLNASNANDTRQILEQHQELLSEEADSILDAISKDSQDEEIVNAIQYCRSFLALCRVVGVAQAFEEKSSSSKERSEDLLMILEEISSLSKPQDMLRKIILLQQALSLIRLQSNPVLWAGLQMTLGNSLYHTQENRRENIEQAIEHYNQALKVFMQKDFRMEWAQTQNNLAAAYCDRIKGDRAENIEKAIEYYNQVLEVFTQKDFPVYWAQTQNNLANAYSDRIRGDKAENIEQAIEHYNQTLQVRTQNEFPVEWAMIQNNLGLAYRDRIKGDRAENIEQAIECCNQALKVRKYQILPVEWAMTQNILGLAYNDRIRGDKNENIEKAIKCLKHALKVFTQKDFPVYWAQTQNNLANAYSDRIRGDKAENIEQAINYYNQALKVRTRQNSPMDWAETQSNLATAYSDRILGDRAENIEQAKKHCIQSLTVRTQKDFPIQWAKTQHNLATIYSERVQGDKAENIEQAIEHYKQALIVRTPEDFPIQWALTQNNLANVYLSRIQGDKEENIEQAIVHYDQALKVRTYEDFPVDWAMTQNNLAIAYKDRIKGDKDENIKKAIVHHLNALKIYKLESMPDHFRNTCRLLGNLHIDTCRWKDAAKSYKDAIDAGDLLYLSGLSAESKIVEVGKNADIYQNASFAAYRLGLASQALLVLERGKTRLLSEALRLRMRQPEGVPKEEWKKYKDAADEYSSVIKHSGKEDYTQQEKRAQNALKELNSAVKSIQSYNPEFQKELEISDILSIPDSETALLTFCITDKGSFGFVISRSSGIQQVDIPDFKSEDLNNLLFKHVRQGIIKFGWVGNYLSYHNAVDTKTRRDAFHTWQNTLNNVLSSLGSKIFTPLLAEIPSQIEKLILLPSGGLFLLPLHAIPLSDGQPLCKHYCISYAPSIPLLKEMQSDAMTTEGEDLYAVINPQEDPALVFSGCEGQAISRLFESRQVNVGKTGTRATVLEGVPGKAYIHFSCHGNYNWNDPPQSGLYLVGGRTLSLADLQNDEVNISSARLVTLSTCETGITDILKGSADEFVGLPAGFMLAGVPCVVSSLWSVPDISTAMLMERFYSNHIVGKMDIPMALQDAQIWVRDLTSRQVADYVDKCYRSGKWEGKSKENIEQYRKRYLKLAEESPEEKPFEHPYYWAAFTVNGA